MATPISRRQFVRLATLSTLGLAGGGIVRAADPPAHPKPLYAFPLLGDLHYDRWEHHDLDWVKKEKGNDLRQIEGYVATTSKHTPGLFDEVAAAVRRLKANDIAVPFVVQAGDLVEGLCGSFELQSLQFRDATAAVEKAAWGAPMLLTKGNHDVTGPGASESFDKVLLPWLSKQAGRELRSASYTLRQGDDLLLFFDAYKPDLEWLATTLEARENRAKRLFFVIHPPVIPYNARADWHVYAKDNRKAERARLLALLGKHRAMVLSGHLHKYSLLTRRTPDGPIAQLAVCSVLRAAQEKPRQVLDGVAQYGPDLVALEPQHAPATVDQRRALLGAESPFIERFEYADTAGYGIVKVYEDRTEVELYAGVGPDAWKSRKLADA